MSGIHDFSGAMQEVLQRPDYDILTGRAIDYQQVIMEALGRAIISLLEQVRLSLPYSPEYNLQAMTFAFIISAALLLLAASMGITYLILKRRGRKIAINTHASAIFDDIANKRFTLSELLDLSLEYARRHEFRDAIRHYYIAVLVDLHDKNTIRVDKSKTNAQLSKELESADPALLGPFVSLVDIFHKVWFGNKSIDEEKYRLFAANAKEVLQNENSRK